MKQSVSRDKVSDKSRATQIKKQQKMKRIGISKEIITKEKCIPEKLLVADY